jgi:hypothetical protein
VAEEGTFRIVDADGPVKKIDFTCTKGDYAGQTWRGLYKLEGDRYSHFGPSGVERWGDRPEKWGPTTETTWLRALRREKP